MARGNTKKKVTGKREDETPASGRAGKRASKDKKEREHEEGEEAEQSDANATDEGEEDEDEDEPAPVDPKKKGSFKAPSKQTDEGGEKGQMFKDVERNATEGRALPRGNRSRNAPVRFGQDKGNPIVIQDEASSEDEKRKDKKLDKGKRRATDNTPDTQFEPGKRADKGKGKDTGKKRSKKDGFERPHSRERHKNHKKALQAPDLNKNAGARRVLAQRDVGGKSYYLLDWFPTWVREEHVLQKLVAEWKKHESPHTFVWGRDRVYHIKNPTSDVSGEHARSLLESVFQMYGEYMEAENHAHGIDDLVNELFINHDWEFLDVEQKDEADTLAGEGNLTAAEILRRTFRNAWNHRPHSGDGLDPAYDYGDILVQYNSWLDDKSPDDQLQPAKGKTVRSLISPMFAPRLWNPTYMDVSKWRHDQPTQLRQQIRQLAAALGDVVRNCPFLLKQPWPLMLVALFWWKDELRNLINAGDFRFTLLDTDENYATGDGTDDSWEWRMADKMMYTYMDECDWEWRCIDEVWTTFVEAQLLITELSKATASPPDYDDENDPEPKGGNGKGKGKYKQPKAPPKNNGRKSGAAPKKPQGQPPPMTGVNGEGPSGCNTNGAKRKLPEDDNDDLYADPDLATKAAAWKNATASQQVDAQPSKNPKSAPKIPAPPPPPKPTSAPAKKPSSTQPKNPAAPKSNSTIRPSTVPPRKKVKTDRPVEQSSSSESEIPHEEPSPRTLKKKEEQYAAKKAEKAAAQRKCK